MCGVCGATNGLQYQCNYCDGEYCPEHRLPEDHDCDGVRFLADPGKRFESKFSDEIVRTGEKIEPPKPMSDVPTISTTPEPEWDNPSPDTKLKSGSGNEESERLRREPLLDRFLRWLG